MEDLLSKEMFVCSLCGESFPADYGTWPQYNDEQEEVLDADLNNRSRDEFVCYDCCG
jgi:hypothetical protein